MCTRRFRRWRKAHHVVHSCRPNERWRTASTEMRRRTATENVSVFVQVQAALRLRRAYDGGPTLLLNVSTTHDLHLVENPAHAILWNAWKRFEPNRHSINNVKSRASFSLSHFGQRQRTHKFIFKIKKPSTTWVCCLHIDRLHHKMGHELTHSGNRFVSTFFCLCYSCSKRRIVCKIIVDRTKRMQHDERKNTANPISSYRWWDRM